jgi:hypothetical protein
MDCIRQPLVSVCVLILVVNAGATSALSRATDQDFFGTGRTSFLRLSIDNEMIRWDILRNPVEGAPVTRQLFFGDASDSHLTGDFDGDSVADIAIWKADPQGHFDLKLSSDPDPEAIHTVAWGTAGDIPGRGDFDGDGTDDFLAIRQENDAYVWNMLLSSGGSRRTVFGNPRKGSLPVLSGQDFNGDGRDDLIILGVTFGGSVEHLVKDALTGEFILDQTFGNLFGSGVITFLYGDYVGDSRADITLNYGRCAFGGKCSTAGTWRTKETGSENIRVVEFGSPLDPFNGTGDSALLGDYDGDGKLDAAGLRSSNNTFYILQSSNLQVLTQHWDGNTASPAFDTQTGGLSLNNKPGPNPTSIPLNAINTFLVRKNADGSYRLERVSHH